MAPLGSSEAKHGTNPLAYAFPYDGGVAVFDTATAAMAYYGVVEAMLRGEALPEGVGFDGRGIPTTDASKVLGLGGREAVGVHLRLWRATRDTVSRFSYNFWEVHSR